MWCIQHQLYAFNWKTLLSREGIQKLEDPPTRWVYNRPVRRAVLTVYERVLGEVSWIKNNGCEHQNKCPDQWETCTSFVGHPNLDDILHAHNLLHLKYPCDPSQSPSEIWDKVVWKRIDGAIEQQLYTQLSAQYQSHFLTQRIFEDISLDEKINQKRKI